MIFRDFPGLIRKSFGILGVAQRRTTVLTTAQVLALHTTPVSLIPAPGAGKYIEVISVVAKTTFNTIAYTGSNALELRYTDGSGVKVTGDIAAALVNAAATRADKALGAAVAVMVANAAVVAVVPVADPAAGNSPITIDVLYRIVTNA